MTKHEATKKIKIMLLKKTKDEVSKELGISRPTLDFRLQNHNWKVSEIALISTL